MNIELGLLMKILVRHKSTEKFCHKTWLDKIVSGEKVKYNMKWCLLASLDLISCNATRNIFYLDCWHIKMKLKTDQL